MKFHGKEIFDEDPLTADCYRQRYVDGCRAFIAKMNENAKDARTQFINAESLQNNREELRQKYKDMLGVNKFGPSDKKVEKIYVGRDDICDIYRITVYITDEIPFYAMLLIPFGAKNLPLVIAQHGGGGTPELCCDMNGKNNYNNMAQRALKRGAVVLAPQLMLWSLTESEGIRAHGVKYDRLNLDCNLKRFGCSITGLEITGIIRAIDYAITLPEVDKDKICMVGLSYGGFFTIHTMAADTRIQAGYSAGAFNDKNVYDWMDWSYFGSALMFQDAEVAALCAPRKLYVQVGKADEVFNYEYAIKEAKRAQNYFELQGCKDNFRFMVWDGGHTLSDDEEGYDFIFSDL